MRIWIAEIMRHRKAFLDLMVGVPSYEAYVDHMKVCHPDQPVQSRAEFFSEAQKAKYSGKEGRMRCC